jgi:hypothetical protein
LMRTLSSLLLLRAPMLPRPCHPRWSYLISPKTLLHSVVSV